MILRRLARWKALYDTDARKQNTSRGGAKLGTFIEKTGYVKRAAFGDLFSGLCFNIINQQLSMKAADTLFSKVKAAVGAIVPENMTNAEKLYSPYGTTASVNLWKISKGDRL